jgi:uncharacterized protein YhaN
MLRRSVDGGSSLMRIEEFHVDGFGRFCGLSLKQVPTGLSIVLGDNEAGKSTLLAFLRSVLFGLPTRGQKLFYPPFNGGRKGGRLVLTDRQQERIIVERCEGKGSGPLTVTFPDGRTGGEDVFRPLIGSATAELYENVFAFSLTELQQFESLRTEKVRDAIYSAGIGAGRKTLTEISKGLRNRHTALFTPGGSKPAMNKLLAQVEAVQKQLKDHQHDQDRYEQICLDLKAADSLVESLRAGLQTARSKSERVKILQQAWDVWTSLEGDRRKLATVPEVELFPINGVKLLDELNLEVRNFQDQLSNESTEKNRLSSKLDGMRFDDSVEAAKEAICRLERGRELFEQTVQKLPEQKTTVSRAEEKLNGLLKELGDHWDESRVENNVVSAQLRNQIDAQVQKLKLAAVETRDHQTHLRAVQQDLTDAEEELASANHQLQRLPELCDAELVAAAEQVVRGRDAFESQQSDLLRLQGQLENGIAGLQDTLRNIGADWDEARLQDADTSLAVHAEVENYRNGLTRRSAEHQQAANRVKELRRQLADAKMDRAAVADSLAALDEPGPDNEDVLLEKRRALRSLRDLVTEVEHRQEKLADLTERATDLTAQIDRLRQSDSESSPAIPAWVVPLVLALGAAVFFGIGLGREDWISGSMVLAFSIALAILLCLVRRSLIRTASVQVVQRAQAMADCESRLAESRQSEVELKSRMETLRQNVTELTAAAKFSEQCEFSSLDLSRFELRTLDEAVAGVETALRLLQRRRPLEEKLLAADAKLTREEFALSSAEELRRECVERLNEEQKKWSDWLEAAEFPQSMTPETVAGVLARLDAAREQLKSIDRDRGQVEELHQAMQKFELQSRKAAEEWQSDNGSNEDVLRMVDALKARLTDHELDVKTGEEAKRRVRDAETQLVKKRKNIDDATVSVRESGEREKRLNREWLELLKQAGIEESLTVETAQRVFQSVERTRDHLSSVQEGRAQRRSQERLIEEYRTDVRAVAGSVGQPEPSDEEVSGVLSGLLTLLSNEEKSRRDGETLLEKIAEADSRFGQLEQQIGTRQERIAELLEAASSSNEDSFRKKAVDLEARQTLQHRIQQGEIQLQKLVGGGDALKALEKKLQSCSLEELNHEQTELAEQIEELDEKYTDAADERGRLKEQLDQLEDADELSALRINEQSSLADFEVAAGEWSVLKLAAHLIERARVKYEKERRPAVLKEAEKYFARFTEGNYVEIRPSDDGSHVVVLTPDGQIKSADQLSRGTAEQLYLSLRFGFVNEFVTHSEPLPLVFDDILVNFDPRRARAAAEAILELAEAQQILFFTCQPSIADLFQQIDSEVSTFKVKDGRFV